MKIHKIKRSVFYSISIVAILRLLFLFIPIYTSEVTIIVPRYFRLYEIDLGIYEIDLGAHTGKEKCLNIKVKFDKLNDKTIFNLTSKSLIKQKSIKCIEDGVNYIKSEINRNNAKINQLTINSSILNNKVDDLINNINSSKSLTKDKLILINDYFRNKNSLKKYTKVPSPLPYQINTNPIKNYNLFRYLFSGFILFFWISYVLLDEKKTNND